jgi:hypothetical protein
MEVKVFTLCDHCSTLRESVEKREHHCYWPRYSVSMTSCIGCFESAKKSAAAEAQGLIVCC